MPCLTPFSDSAEEIKANADAEKAQLKQRIEVLEAMLCGTRKAFINANRELGRRLFEGINYEAMGVTPKDYMTDFAQHAEKDMLKNPPKPRIIGS